VRPVTVLAALALLAATRPGGAVPTISAGRAVILPPSGPAQRQSARVRFTLADDALTALAVEIDVTYLPGAKLPDQDVIHLAHDEPVALEAQDDDGHAVEVRTTVDHALVVDLDRTPFGLPPARAVRVRFRHPVPPIRKHGWTAAGAEVALPAYGFQVERSVTTIVVLPGATKIDGFACAPRGEDTECTRATPGRMEPFTLLLRPRQDLLGLALLVLTSLAAVLGFARVTRHRARGIVAAVAAVVAVPEAERPGGAYRAAPAQALGVQAGDARAGLRRLWRHAATLALVALASTAAVAFLAAGRSPWPMPSIMAAWVALVGFAAALAVERG
jgi:hypothetical protein